MKTTEEILEQLREDLKDFRDRYTSLVQRQVLTMETSIRMKGIMSYIESVFYRLEEGEDESEA